MTKTLNFKMYRNKFQLLVNWVGDRPDWQFLKMLLEHLTFWTNITANILLDLVMTYGNDIRMTTRSNFKISRNSVI